MLSQSSMRSPPPRARDVKTVLPHRAPWSTHIIFYDDDDDNVLIQVQLCLGVVFGHLELEETELYCCVK